MYYINTMRSSNPEASPNASERNFISVHLLSLLQDIQATYAVYNLGRNIQANKIGIV